MSTHRPAELDPISPDPLSTLQQQHQAWQQLFASQPPIVQRFLESQAGQLAQSLTHRDRLSQAQFRLPDAIVLEPGGQPVSVPPEFREQMAGGLVDRLTRTDMANVIRQRLTELEQSPNRALAVSAGLLRYAAATHMVEALLPSGRSVSYAPAGDDVIPSIPVSAASEPESAITAPTDAIAEEVQAETARGELQVPYVPAARRFYLPRWVAFDDEDQLLVGTLAEAEAHVGSMQRFLAILHAAVALAPYMLADPDYQQKRYGMLGQLVNQGRALARHQTRQIIQTIKRRAAAEDLNRGLSVSVPYFDDQALRLKSHDFEVIPAGRIMFVPAFVVRASREEQAKVAQDTRLSPSTRIHLLTELSWLERAFDSRPGVP